MHWWESRHRRFVAHPSFTKNGAISRKMATCQKGFIEPGRRKIFTLGSVTKLRDDPRESIGFGSAATLLCITEQINFSSGHMRLQPIVATCILPAKAPEEAAFVGTEGSCLDFAYADERFHAAVVPGVNGRDCDLSRSDLDILVALDLFHRDLACKHANTQVYSSGNLDLDVEVVVAVLQMRSFYRQFAATRCRRKMKDDFPGSFVVGGRAGNMKLLPVGADDLKSSRPRIDNQHGPGLQRVIHSLAAKDLCLGESGDIAGEESHAHGVTDRSHILPYARRDRLVPDSLADEWHSSARFPSVCRPLVSRPLVSYEAVTRKRKRKAVIEPNIIRTSRKHAPGRLNVTYQRSVSALAMMRSSKT